MTTFITARNAHKCERCLTLGANFAINYTQQNFAEQIGTLTHGEGVNLVLDCVGGPYLADHLACLAPDGRLLLIAVMGGTTASLDMGVVLRKRLQIIGSTLRARSNAFKAQLIEHFLKDFGAHMQAGTLMPVIDSVFCLADAARAHARVAGGEHFGKVVLSVD